ncbi:MAG: metallopeptidase TldD-related protein [Lachnospiraceae bacterium]
MVKTILDALKKNQIDTYLINEEKLQTAELFFIRRNLDMKRAENIHSATVTVYRDFEKDGVKYRGNAVFTVEPSTSEEEIQNKCQKAYLAASFVPNQFYELAGSVQQDCVVMKSNLAQISLEEAAKIMVKALYEADTDTASFINSAEMFVERKEKHIVNSNGVDVSYVKYNVNGEFVAQCKEPQDVETHQSFAFDTLNTAELTDIVRLTLQMTKDRALATTAAKAGEYDVILSDEYVATVFENYIDRASGSYIHMGYSDYKVGEFVQGKKEEVSGELLNLHYLPTEPFSNEGVVMKELPMIENGVFKNIQANCRYGYYLKVPVTGLYRKISCDAGKMNFEDMKKHKGLYVVNFSDFQMDSFSGYFGGEIRLAYLNDGEKIVPVTGGSINGSIFEAQKNFVFSKEKQETSRFLGPKAVMLKKVSVAGV